MSIDHRLAGREIEAEQLAALVAAAAAVVNQRAAVRRPVRRFERQLGAVNRLPPAALHVEQLEHAADVVAIRHEAVLRRPDDADVAEHGALDDVGIVRAQRQADQHLVAEIAGP